MAEPEGRRLAAVMFCDMVGFTAGMQEDEQLALASRTRYRTVIEDLHDEFGGEIVQYYGDGTLSIFSNSVDAVRCAVAIQQTLSKEPVVPVRVGLHVGDVIVEEHGLLGDAVNVASRIESFGVPGAVLVSDSVHDLIKNQPDLELVSLGEFHLDNVARPHELFAVEGDGLVVPEAETLVGKGRPVGAAVLSNLPVQVTSFVGRIQESAELEKLIRGSRLVTVTGAGGCGKSRLTVEVAAELLDEYSDGVWLVELAPLSDGRLLASTVANVLGVREQPGTDTLKILTGYLANKRLLLVVDNCEHLIEQVADLVAHVLAHTTDLRIVATSREGLSVRGEAVYHLPTLPVPHEDDDWETLTHNDSVRLLAERAEAAHPGFRVTHDNGQAVASICRHLDGIPLAVELAAAATRMFTPEQIDQRLDDRFQLLTGGARDDVDHHRTLEGAIDWSYQLLTPQQQEVLARLAVFAGSFTLDAAEQVCADGSLTTGDVMDAVGDLADSSLLEVEQTETGVRYDMLETIRAFATDRFVLLPESEQKALSRRHCDYFLSLAEEVTEGPVSAEAPPSWLAKLNAVVPDLRRAFGWAVDGGHDQMAVDFAGALGFFWALSERRAEGVRWVESVPLDSAKVTSQSRSHALRQAAWSMAGRGHGAAVDLTKAKEMAQRSLQLAREVGDHVRIAASLHTLGHVSWSAGERHDAVSIFEEGITEAQEGGSAWWAAMIRHWLALYHRDYGPTEKAKHLLAENLPIFRRLGDDRMMGLTLGFLAITVLLEGDSEEAQRLGLESLEIGRRIDTFAVVGNALETLAEAAYLDSDFETAQNLYRERNQEHRTVRGREPADALLGLSFVDLAQSNLPSARKSLDQTLRLLRSADDSSNWDEHLQRRGLWGTALLLVGGGLMREAAVLSGAVDAATHVTPARQPWRVNSFEDDMRLQMTEAIESTLTPDELLHAREQGAAMTLDEAVDYALNLLEDA